MVPARTSTEDALRDIEARLAAIIASAMDAIISIDESHNIVVFNAAAERIFRCSAADALGTSIHRFLPERYRAMHEHHIRAFAATGVTTRSMGALRPLTGLRTDGTEFPIEATISQVEVEGHRLFTVILRDISERKASEAERDRLLEAEKAAREAAEQANRAKSEFLAVMSHELRTPLNAIAGYAQLLQMGVHGPTTADQQDALHRIQKNQTHLLSLINEVLNFTRLESARIEYECTDFEVDGVLAGLEPLVAPQLRAKGLTYRHERDDALMVHADRERVQQILLNLMSNAIKFTARGGSITVSASPRDRAVAIHVRDTGAGIPAKQMERIFEPFVQVDRRLTREQEGIGLGLAISRELARGMGGELSVSSIEHRGSTFTLQLPRAGEPVAGDVAPDEP